MSFSLPNMQGRTDDYTSEKIQDRSKGLVSKIGYNINLLK